MAAASMCNIVAEAGVCARMGPFVVDAPRVETEDVRAAAEEGEEAALLVDEPASLFTARVDPRTKARVGSKATPNSWSTSADFEPNVIIESRY